MDVLEAIKTRRSIRKYKDQDVPWDNIVTIMEAGKYAPSAGNLQNWKFIHVKAEAKKSAIAKACLQQDWMEVAPIYIVVIGEPEKAERHYGTRGARLYTIQGCAAAMQNMLLAAHSLGLATCWIGAFDEDEIFRILNLPEGKTVQGIITIGYADVRAIMKNGGVAAIGVGSSDTTNKVEEAVKGALQNPLLDINYKGATGALLHIIGGPDMTLDDISKIGELVTESLDADANVIWGARVLDDMKGKLTVMTIVTGVKSPWILGKSSPMEASPEVQQISDELGIEILDE